ncbi:hypothetical protein [Dyella caseinilytica]|nr:hypothetical protein [Dyella caseinilytica]
MTRIYSAYHRFDAPEIFDAVEQSLWAEIIQHLERFNHEAD